MSNTFLKIHPADNVLVALTDLHAGTRIGYNGSSITLPHDVPAKHKFVINDLDAGAEVIMYGILVGKTVAPIPEGGAIGTHNVKHKAASFENANASFSWTPPDISKFAGRTFAGYHRKDGQVGTANYWLVVPLVFCENRNIHVIKTAFEETLGFVRRDSFKQYVQQLVDAYREGDTQKVLSVKPAFDSQAQSAQVFKNIDGIKFLTHEGGCGGTRQDSEALCALIAGYIKNPNVAGATVLSLGCQNAQADILNSKLQAIGFNNDKPLYVLEQQQEGTEQELLVNAIQKTFLGLAEANKLERQPAPLSKLVVGLECGGSDGFSGISANPAVGHASDLIVELGGTTILSEFPELCGVEQELINRCTSDTVADRFVSLMRAYSQAAVNAGSGFDMNPSPGNIKDGLITDAMKSAGAAKKGGTSPITDVIDYGEYVSKPGLNLQCTPGNDVESTTAMAGAGANVILFTTGLGTPTGNPVAPVIKISSNTKLATKMPDIIDVDCGGVISGTKNIEQSGQEILEYIISVASGETKPKAVLLNQDDFIPWKRGVSL